MARIARELGLPLMPWQAYIIDVAHEIDPVTGWWAYDEIVITVPRQAGKTTLKIPVYVHRLSNLEMAEIWMTAQTGGKALDRWNKARMTLEHRSSPVRDLIKSWTSIAHERVEWRATLSTLRPFTPNEKNMHGESPDLVDVDEWWAFDAVAAEDLTAAYSPGFLTRNAQAWKTSTRGKSWSAGLNDDVKKGRAAVELGRRSGTAYFEWSLPGRLGGVELRELPDDDLIAACVAIHPAIGFHPTAPAERMVAKIAADLTDGDGGKGKMTRGEFIRAYANRTSDESSGWQVISEPAWVAAQSKTAIPHGVPVGLGFDVDPEGRDAAVAVAWRRPDGVAIGEIVIVQDGARWVPDTVDALRNRWDIVQEAVNNAGPSRDQADTIDTRWKREAAALDDDRVKPRELLRLSQMDYGAACARVLSQVTATTPQLMHIGQQPLNDAAEHVGRRRIGLEGAWAWARNDEVSISPLVAWTVAVWAADHPRETEPDIGPFWIR